MTDTREAVERACKTCGKPTGGAWAYCPQHDLSNTGVPWSAPVAVERARNIRAFAQDYLDQDVTPRAAMGNVMAIRDEADKLIAPLATKPATVEGELRWSATEHEKLKAAIISIIGKVLDSANSSRAVVIEKYADRLLSLIPAQPWRPIVDAPRDGTPVILLSGPTETIAAEWQPSVKIAAQVWLGQWWIDGNSWVAKDGTCNGSAHHLAVTGVWLTDLAWFQPNEVTHFLPLPEPPDE